MRGWMRWALLVLVLSLSAVPGTADARRDLGGGAVTWTTTPVEPRYRTVEGRPDACQREDFRVAIEAPVFVTEAEGLRHTGPLLVSGTGGTFPCWFGERTGWLDVRAEGLPCHFEGIWLRFFDGLITELVGSCGSHQVRLLGTLAVTGPQSAAGPLVVTDCDPLVERD